MSLENLLNNLEILEGVKVVLFIFAFLFSASYLIPRGMVYFLKWKETGKLSQLSTSITFISGGFFILAYFLAMFVVDSIKKMSL